MSIRENIEIILRNISNAAEISGNAASRVIVVCISKNRTLEEIYQVMDAGINNIGESKIQEAEKKYAALTEHAKDADSPLHFHLVGHLQTNKVNKALDIFDLIHSVDSLRLAQKINEASKKKEINTDILIEVKTSQEKSKFGVMSDEVIALLKKTCFLENITVRGLMTIAPLVENKDDARPYFRQLRQLRDKINEINEPLFAQRIKMDFLSMGMSQDYEIAVQEGANMLRIGTAIFEGKS